MKIKSFAIVFLTMVLFTAGLVAMDYPEYKEMQDVERLNQLERIELLESDVVILEELIVEMRHLLDMEDD